MLEFGYVDVLLARQVLDREDLAIAFELEEVVQQRDEQGLARFGAEDPLEHEVGLGVRKDGEEVVRPTRPGGNVVALAAGHAGVEVPT